jgi:hypothetical protein
MDKQAMREEAERLIRETMARKALVVKQGNTRIETTNAARPTASRRKRALPASSSPANNVATSKRRCRS